MDLNSFGIGLMVAVVINALLGIQGWAIIIPTIIGIGSIVKSMIPYP